MEWRESRDYNPLVRAILLLGLAAFLVKLIVTGEIRLYIHPRFTWFTATAAVGMSLMALGQLIRAVSGATYGPPLRVRLYTAVAAVLCTGFLVRPVTFSADLAAKQGLNITKRGDAPASAPASPPGGGPAPAAPNPEAPGTPTPEASIPGAPAPEASTPQAPAPGTPGGPPLAAGAPGSIPSVPPEKAAVLVNNTVNVTTKNFVNWMNELYKSPAAYAGKRVVLEGFVFHPPDTQPEEFALTRLVVTCHVAHAFPDGLLTYLPEQERPAQDEWYRAEGVLEFTVHKGMQTLRIRVDRWTPVPQPEDPYIYP